MFNLMDFDRHPRLGGFSARYSVLGGGSKPKAPKPTPPAPTEAAPEVALAAANERERLRRARGRPASQVTTPQQLASSPGIILKTKLG